MRSYEETIRRLSQIPDLSISVAEPLSRHTRFGVGGAADVYVETAVESSFIAALLEARASGGDSTVIGSGTNLIVADDGFRGIVLRFTGADISQTGLCVEAQAGAELQQLVDFSIDRGLKGIETMTGIPGAVGAAVYGNAGAYGHSIMERVQQVRFFDGATIRLFTNAECEFHYRESVFKRHKDWVIFSTNLHLDAAPAGELRESAGAILKIRNEKYPPTM